MNEKSPCFECKDRIPSCHDICMKYESWKLTKHVEHTREKQDKEAWLVARKGRRRHRSV